MGEQVAKWELRDQIRRNLKYQSLDERLAHYLDCCCQPGHSYHRGWDRFPTIFRLAQYANVNPSTIQKLKSGGRLSVKLELASIVAILGGICPAIDFDQRTSEQSCRLRDADEWVDATSEERDDLVTWLIVRIKKRATQAVDESDHSINER